jgi:hypothetical protein
MGETANRDIDTGAAADDAPLTTKDMTAAIRGTRVRLATRLARTGDHIHRLFTAPAPGEGVRDHGVIGAAVTTITIAGRARRVWRTAKESGVLRSAAIGVATLIALAFAVRKSKALLTRRGVRRIGGQHGEEESETRRREALPIIG